MHALIASLYCFGVVKWFLESLKCQLLLLLIRIFVEMFIECVCGFVRICLDKTSSLRKTMHCFVVAQEFLRDS